jgi:predicted phosphodiesterase
VAYLIVSDIHSNLEALQAVLADARGLYDRILCLGDLVGYGADPNAVVEWARANLAAVVRGNHDVACVRKEPLEGYNASARKSAEWTRGALTEESRAYLEQLPSGPLPWMNGQRFDLVHGSPVNEDDYLVSAGDVWPLYPALDTRLTFFGHTHLQGGFLVARTGVRQLAPRGTMQIGPDHYFLVNPGSVGQPRDGNPRAAYLLYSPEARTVEFRRVDYDVDAAAAKILAAGLPDSLAARLYEGI